MRYLLYLGLLIFLLGCANSKPKIKIGFSHSFYWEDWGKLMHKEMLEEMSLYNDYSIELIMKDAINSASKQKQDIADFQKEKIDILIVFPVDSMTIVPVVSQVYDSGIPVIVMDRELATTKYTLFIGNDNFVIGREAGIYCLKKLKDNGTVMEITGPSGSPTATERSAGFNKVLSKQANIKTLPQLKGDWLPNKAKTKMDSLLKLGIVPDLIFAHTDLMALAASQACSHLKEKPVIIGVDGLATPGGGLNMVINHQINATSMNYPGGDKAIRCAIDIWEHKKTEKKILLKTTVIDEDNANSLLIASEIQNEQMGKIYRQKEQIAKMANTIELQHTVIALSIAFLALFLLLIIIILRNSWQKQNYISVIQQHKDQIEEQMTAEKALTETLTINNNLLQEKQEEILLKQQQLEIYQNDLEKLVQEKTADLQIALQRAEESDRLKTSFLSNLSHEIRTPLNAIIGFSGIITDLPMRENEKIKYASYIEQSSNDLLLLIDNIVEISKLTAQKIDIEKRDIDILKLFQEIQNETVKQIQATYISRGQKDIRFEMDMPENIIITTDNRKVKQILTHLINNAFKFTNKGCVTLGYFIGLNKDEVIFYVKDTGIGIKKKNQEFIFDKFTKVENDNNHQLFRGSGLGLAIAKSLTELLGGTISVESELGKGSIFSVKLPMSGTNPKANCIGEDVPKPQAAARGSDEIKILVAEDEDSNYLYIKALVLTSNIKLERATNGAEVVRYLSEKERPDMVLMDIKMPVMDGIEALKQIKPLYPDLIVIALTAYGFTSDKQRLLNEGFDDYLSKPLTRNVFLEKIQFHLKKAIVRN